MKFKIRAWDEKKKKYYRKIKEEAICIGFRYADNEIIIFTPEGNQLQPLFFTGITDKNENEIYEGDIVEFERSSCFLGDNKSICKVEYDECLYQWQMALINPKKDKPAMQLRSGQPFSFFCVSSGQLLVIGNKFEHPELLEQNNDPTSQKTEP